MKQDLLLIVDHEVQQLQALQSVFEPDYQVEISTDCQQALQILEQQSVNAMLCNYRMPEMTGLSLQQQVQRLSPNTMRLLLVDEADKTATDSALDSGEIHQCIETPWELTTIREHVAEVMKVSHKLSSVSPIKPGQILPVQRPAKPELLVLDIGKTIFRRIDKLFSESCSIQYSNSFDSCIEAITESPVKVVILNISEGDQDYLSFLKTLRAEYPMLVTVAVVAENDSDEILKLINEGHIYRYLPFSIPSGRTRICIQSAIKFANDQLFKKEQGEQTVPIAEKDKPDTYDDTVPMTKKNLFGLGF